MRIGGSGTSKGEGIIKLCFSHKSDSVVERCYGMCLKLNIQ